MCINTLHKGDSDDDDDDNNNMRIIPSELYIQYYLSYKNKNHKNKV
jgi:hypothetical protein